MKIKNFGILSGNALKIIAALSMLIDHIGVMFFPQVKILRIIGRIAMPIFSFMIAEGARYTRNKARYFLTVFGLAAVCQLVYFLYDGDTYMSILVTFSLSILTIYALDFFKESLFSFEATALRKILSCLLFLSVVTVVYYLNTILEIDYGFLGCMLPVFASVFHAPKNCDVEFLKKLDVMYIHLLMLSVGLVCLAVSSGGTQPWSLLAVPFLSLYSGKRGKANMKYFFYIFYPAHLLILEGINIFI